MVSGLVKQNEEVPNSSILQAMFNGLCLVKQNEEVPNSSRLQAMFNGLWLSETK